MELKQPKKLMLAGDWHGNLPWAFRAINHAKANGADTILHLGDFGWWIPSEKTDQFLNELNAELIHCNINLLWIDGNHEYHPSIPHGGEPWNLARFSRITHLPRGYRWEWWGQTWMALGGAHSVDRLARTPGVDWWPEESLTVGQVHRACGPGIVDVIVAHDCPSGVAIPGIVELGGKGNRKQKWNPEMFPESELIASENHRKLVKQVVDTVEPLAFFHGHYHRAYEAWYEFEHGETMFVRGLDRDGSTMGRNIHFLTEGF